MRAATLDRMFADYREGLASGRQHRGTSGLTPSRSVAGKTPLLVPHQIDKTNRRLHG
jgi:hypothetical protein